MAAQDPWDDFHKTRGMSAADQWGKIADDSRRRVREMQVESVKRKSAIHDEGRLRTEARIKRSAYSDKAKGYKLQRYQRVVIGEASRLDRAVSPILDRKILPKGYKPNRAERAVISGGRSTGSSVARAAAKAAGRAVGAAAVAAELAYPAKAGQGSGSERTLARRSPKMARQYADHQARRAVGASGVSPKKAAKATSGAAAVTASAGKAAKKSVGKLF